MYILDRQRGLPHDVLRILHEDTFITVELTKSDFGIDFLA
jgi:hypothetical protein